MKVELGNYVRIRTGKLDANESSSDGAYPFFTCARAPLWIAKYSFDCECVLVAGNGDLNVKYYNGKFDAYQRTYVIESLDKSVLDVRYLFHFMDTYLESLRHLSIGGVIKYIKLGNLTEAKIPLPLLPEQRRIAAILDKADALRTQRREALAQLDRLSQAIFVEMFGEPERHIRNGEVEELAQVTAPDRIVTYGIVQAGPEVPDGVPYIKTGDIKGGEIIEHQLARTSREIADSYARSMVAQGDIMMSIRATVGTTALVPPSLDGANLTQGTARISPGSRVTSGYLLSYLRTDSIQRWIQAQVKGATFREITLGKLRQLPVHVPQLPLQREFECRSLQVAKLRERQLAVLSMQIRIFESLQHRAFRGEL